MQRQNDSRWALLPPKKLNFNSRVSIEYPHMNEIGVCFFFFLFWNWSFTYIECSLMLVRIAINSQFGPKWTKFNKITNKYIDEARAISYLLQIVNIHWKCLPKCSDNWYFMLFFLWKQRESNGVLERTSLTAQSILAHIRKISSDCVLPDGAMAALQLQQSLK